MTIDEINIEMLKVLQSEFAETQRVVKLLKEDSKLAFSDIRESTKYSELLSTRITQVSNRITAYDNIIKKIGKFFVTIAGIVVVALAIIGFGVLLSGPCKAEELQPAWKIGNFQLLDVDKVSFEYAKIKNQRDGFYLVDDENFDYRMAFLMDFRLLEVLYWKNDVHMMAADDHVRAVGWQYEGGVHIFKNADLFWFHHSQHVLEREPPPGISNPLENRYGFRINFINK